MKNIMSALLAFIAFSVNAQDITISRYDYRFNPIGVHLGSHDGVNFDDNLIYIYVGPSLRTTAQTGEVRIPYLAPTSTWPISMTCPIRLTNSGSSPEIEISGEHGVKRWENFLDLLKRYAHGKMAETLVKIKHSPPAELPTLRDELENYRSLRSDLMDHDFSNSVGIADVPASRKIVIKTGTTPGIGGSRTDHYSIITLSHDMYFNLCARLSGS